MIRWWFQQDKVKDNKRQKQFEKIVRKFDGGMEESQTLRTWVSDRDGKLAAIIVLEMMSKMWYLTDEYYAKIAQEIAMTIINQRDLYNQYGTWEQIFILMPLICSNDLEMIQLALDEIQYW